MRGAKTITVIFTLAILITFSSDIKAEENKTKSVKKIETVKSFHPIPPVRQKLNNDSFHPIPPVRLNISLSFHPIPPVRLNVLSYMFDQLKFIIEK